MVGDEVSGGDLDMSHPGLDPGQECPSCHRKVPYPKKESSPDTKTISYRVPLDEADAHEEMWGVVTDYVGISGQKFEKFKVLSLALAAVLLDPKLKGFGKQSFGGSP
jgi:hypothetical protein